MNNRIAIYLATDEGPDSAIVRGLEASDCQIVETRNVSETLERIRSFLAEAEPRVLILAAEVDAGAIPLLMLMRDLLGVSLPTLVFDRKGNDSHAVIKALQEGVREYLLGSDPEITRELSARLLTERAGAESMPTEIAPVEGVEASANGSGASPDTPEGLDSDFQWDAIGHVLHLGETYVRLSPIEGRIFDMLLSNHNRTVPMEELVRHVLSNPMVDIESGVKQLRPHIVRLRRKLERYPVLANRILNMRGSGYMFI